LKRAVNFSTTSVADGEALSRFGFLGSTLLHKIETSRGFGLTLIIQAYGQKPAWFGSKL
jgi:hypothetical protein